MLSKEQVIKRLEKKFPNISGICDGGPMGYGPESILLGDAAEGGTIDDFPACNYYGWESDPKENIWIMGVHKGLYKELGDMGWYAECYDPGTFIAYPV